jgi:hypothetical protein
MSLRTDPPQMAAQLRPDGGGIRRRTGRLPPAAYGTPVARLALSAAAQVLPLNIPEPVRGERGRVFRDCPQCPEMIEIEAGSFLMGSPR